MRSMRLWLYLASKIRHQAEYFLLNSLLRRYSASTSYYESPVSSPNSVSDPIRGIRDEVSVGLCSPCEVDSDCGDYGDYWMKCGNRGRCVCGDNWVDQNEKPGNVLKMSIWVETTYPILTRGVSLLQLCNKALSTQFFPNFLILKFLHTCCKFLRL